MSKALQGLLVATLLVACGRSPAPQRQPVAAPSTEPLPTTLTEVRQAQREGRHGAAEAALKKMVQSLDPAVRKRALASLALLYDEQSRFGEALQTYQGAIASYPEVAAFLRLKAIGVQRKLGRPLEAVALANALLASRPPETVSQSVLLELPVLYAAAGNSQSTSAAVVSTDNVKIDSLNEADFVRMADLLDDAGLPDLAARTRIRLLNEYPQSRHAERLYAQLLALGDRSPLARLDFREALALADRLGRVNRYDQALDWITRIEARFPLQVNDPALRYTRVVSNFNSRRYDKVVSEKSNLDEAYYLDMQLRRARAFWRTERPTQFLTILGDLIRRYPETKEATEARLLLSKYYMTDEPSYGKSAALLEQVIKAGSLGKDGENLWTLGWIHILARKDADAIRAFDLYLKRYPDADYTSNALFWSAKVHGRNGRTSQRDASFNTLIRLYPYSYYSYRARSNLGLPMEVANQINSGFAFPLTENTGAVEDSRLRTIRELMEIGLYAEGAREMQRLAAERPDDKMLAFTLAELYVEAGEPLKANVLLQKNFRDIVRHGGTNVPPRFWEILYPRQHWRSIEAAAVRSAIDPHLITAIIRQESGFDPSVVSNAGAVGLMQIMPQEASRIAQKANLPAITREELFDPQKNVLIGAAEIRQKVAAMGGNQLLGIAAYNAGEDPVGRWVTRTPPDDIDLFVESIPYNETRLYVKSVTRNLFEYRRIYGP